jgi:hypothetical protein
MPMRRRNLDNFIHEAKNRQRNIVFPDTVRNARSIDAYLWKGNPNAPLVQRVGACLIGLFFIGIGLMMLYVVRDMFAIPQDGTLFEKAFTLAATLLILAWTLFWVWFGVRNFLNGFERRKSRNTSTG